MGLRFSKISYKMSEVEQKLGYVADQITEKEEEEKQGAAAGVTSSNTISLPNVTGASTSVPIPVTPPNQYHSNSSLSSASGEISCVQLPWSRSTSRRKGKTFPVRLEPALEKGIVMKKPKKSYLLKGIGGSKKKENSARVVIDEEASTSSISLTKGLIPTTVAPMCVCTAFRRTSLTEVQDQRNVPGCSSGIVEIRLEPRKGLSVPQLLRVFNPEDYPIEDEDEKMRRQRAKEMVEGVELSEKFGMLSLSKGSYQPAHSQIDYIHVLVPDLKEITSCSFYWGKIDRYAAEKLLEDKPEGTFLLRDSAQEEYLFSVSFRRYGRSLHARIEQWGHAFSFDAHDPSVFSAPTVTGLIEHYKDPSYCMFFEPMLTVRLHRNFTFSLQHLARSVVCNSNTYDSISSLPLPKTLKEYCREYHYKQRVRVRNLPE